MNAAKLMVVCPMVVLVRAGGVFAQGAAATSTPTKAPTQAATPASAQEQTERPMEVRFGGQWMPCRVLARDGDRVRVELMGRFEGHQHWVRANTVRPRTAASRAHDVKDEPPRARGGAAGPRDRASSASKVDPEEAPGDALPLTEADRAAGDIINPALAPADGKITIGLAPTVSVNSRPISLRVLTGESFEEVADVLFAPASGEAFVVAVKSPPGTTMQARVEVVQLTTKPGRSRIITLPPGDRPLAVSADGKRLVTRSDGFMLGTKGQLRVWDVSAAEAKHIVGFEPYADRDGFGSDISQAWLIGEDHVLTASAHGGVTLDLWLLPDAKRVWSIDVNRPSANVAIRGDELIIGSNAGVTTHVPTTGEPRALVLNNPTVSDLVFDSADGQLVGVTFDTLLIIQGGSGDVREVLLPHGVRAGAIAPLKGDFVLLDGRYLLDLRLAAMVWEYVPDPQGRVKPVGWFADRYWYVHTPLISNRPTATLVPVDLPTAAAKAAAQATTVEEVTLIGPGSAVALRVTTELQDAAAARNALQASLEEAGYQVVEQAEVTIVASERSGETRQVTYDFGIRREKQTLSAVERVYRVAVEFQGQVAWEVGRTVTPPMTLWVQGNETAEQVLRRHMEGDSGFFRSIQFPTRINKPGRTVPSSTLGAGGVIEQPNAKTGQPKRSNRTQRGT